jgi:hypothetical protein
MPVSFSGATTDEYAESRCNGNVEQAKAFYHECFETYIEDGVKKRRIIFDEDRFHENYESLASTGKYARAGRPPRILKNLKEIYMSGQRQQSSRETRFFTRRRIPITGAPFEGLDSFVEYEDDKIYIPTSFHCLLKCSAKMKGIPYEDFRKSVKGFNPYGITNTAFNKMYRKHFEGEPPQMLEIEYTEKYDDFKIKRFSHNSRKGVESEYSILLLKINKSNDHHAILLKTSDPKSIDFVKDIVPNIKIETCYNITSEQTLYHTVKPPTEPTIPIFVYDIETLTVDPNAKNKEQKPYVVGYSHVVEEDYNKALKGDSESIKDIKSKIKIFQGYGCLYEMLEDLTSDQTRKNKLIMLIAHNGGRFDHIFFKGLPFIKFTKELNAGGTIKELRCKYNNYEIIFKDSCCFTSLSLDLSAKALLGIKESKLDSNLVINQPLETFLKHYKQLGQNDEPVENRINTYLIQDIYMNGLVVQDYENKIMKNFNQSIKWNTGIPSIAWRTINSSCIGMSKQFIASDPSTCKFIRSSMYGGRVFVWKKYFKSENEKDKLISLDANSLYPSAMQKGRYPVGQFMLIKDETDFKRIQKEKLLYIAEITLDGQNCRYPIVPYKTPNNELFYLSNKFSGVYNSVDIDEALSLGYKITEFKQGLYWKHSANIFEPFVKPLYEGRLKKKKVGDKSEYTDKIALNAGYGKTAEHITDRIFFIDKSKEVKEKPHRQYTEDELPCGQKQIKEVDKFSKERNPFHLSSFITAYSRQIMNNYMKKIGFENIYYGDTDSLYTTYEAFEKSGIVESDELGGIKNDYGKNSFITEAYFADIKRYYLELKKTVIHKKGDILVNEKGSIVMNKKGEEYVCKKDEEYVCEKDETIIEKSHKAKFSGISFKYKDIFADFICINESESTSAEIKDFKDAVDETFKILSDKEQVDKVKAEMNAIMKKNDKIRECYVELSANNKLIKPLINQKWKRLKTSVEILDEKVKITVNPEKRAKWSGDKKDIFYPLDFDEDKPERKTSTKQTDFVKLEPLIYDVNIFAKSFTSALPLTEEGNQPLFINPETGIETSYVESASGKLLYRILKPYNKQESVMQHKREIAEKKTVNPTDKVEVPNLKRQAGDWCWYTANEKGALNALRENCITDGETDGTYLHTVYDSTDIDKIDTIEGLEALPYTEEEYKPIIFTSNKKAYPVSTRIADTICGKIENIGILGQQK